MQILINGKPAAIKSGTSFEFVSENRMFSGSDGYTLSITFPLRECPQNLAIFGNIHRPDVDISKMIYDCEIRHRNFIRSGTLTITGVTDIEVKGQFLEGRSEQNFSQTFDKIYINELDLGTPYFQDAADIPPADAWDAADRDWESVALPWVNNSSSGMPHNFAEYSGEDGTYSWSADTVHLTWQPYLLYITRKICDAIGYTYDFSEWETDPRYSRFLICNTLPEAWDLPGYASALPHWTVEEYFEKLELFLAGEFEIDHRSRDITFRFTSQQLAAAKPVKIENVVDEYSVEIKIEDNQCDYSEARNLVYKDPGHNMWKYYSCDWFINSRQIVKEYDTISAMLNDNKRFKAWNGLNLRGNNLTKLLHVKDRDMYFIIRSVSRTKDTTSSTNPYVYTCIMQPVNIFGGRIVDENAEQDELEFVPARIDWTEDKYGSTLFLDIGSYSEGAESSGVGPDPDAFHYTGAQSSLEAGEKSGASEYFSTIFVAYWNGMENFAGKLPHPHVENVEISPDWATVKTYPFSLRLNDTVNDPRPINHRIDAHHKSVFKFLASEIPNVRSVFHIRGKKYICEKITATFTESGMSRLLKGEFFPLLE